MLSLKFMEDFCGLQEAFLGTNRSGQFAGKSNNKLPLWDLSINSICSIVYCSAHWFVFMKNENPRASNHSINYLGVFPRWLYLTMGYPTCCPGHPEIDALNEFANRNAMPAGGTEMARAYTDGSARARVTGGKDLKMSQAYPAGCLGFLHVSTKFIVFACIATPPKCI